MSDEATEKPKRTRKTKAQKEAELAAPPQPPTADPDGAPPESEVLDGVFVVKQVDPQTGELLAPQVIKNGNLGLLEVETLLKLGLKEFQEKMGFS